MAPIYCNMFIMALQPKRLLSQHVPFFQTAKKWMHYVWLHILQRLIQEDTVPHM